MNLEQLKKQIVEYIGQIENLDTSKLYHASGKSTAWQNMTPEEVQKFVEDLLGVLSVLSSSIDLLDGVGFSQANSINSSLANFISQYTAMQNVRAEQITNQHHAPLNQLNQINSLLRQSGLRTEAMVLPDVENKKRELDSLYEDIEKAGKDLAKRMNLLDEYSLERDSNALSSDFEERRTIVNRSKFFWFFLAFAFGLFALHSTSDFVRTILNLNPAEIQNFWQYFSIRLVSLAPVYYFLVLSVSKLSQMMEIEEVYAHKSVLSSVLPSYSNLVKDPAMRDNVLSSSMNMLLKSPLELISKKQKKGESSATDLPEVFKALVPLIKNRD